MSDVAGISMHLLTFLKIHKACGGRRVCGVRVFTGLSVEDTPEQVEDDKNRDQNGEQTGDQNAEPQGNPVGENGQHSHDQLDVEPDEDDQEYRDQYGYPVLGPFALHSLTTSSSVTFIRVRRAAIHHGSMPRP